MGNENNETKPNRNPYFSIITVIGIIAVTLLFFMIFTIFVSPEGTPPYVEGVKDTTIAYCTNQVQQIENWKEFAPSQLKAEVEKFSQIPGTDYVTGAKEACFEKMLDFSIYLPETE